MHEIYLMLQGLGCSSNRRKRLKIKNFKVGTTTVMILKIINGTRHMKCVHIQTKIEIL